jgi:adenylate kinase
LRIYFVAGVHGSGKSQLCQELSRSLGVPHLRASQLIGYVPEPSDDTGKRVPDVQGNQDRLVAALRDRRPAGEDLILDGHFCLLDKAGRIVRIPAATFTSIDPLGIILVTATPHVIQARLERRDNVAYPLPTIETLIREEQAYAREIGGQLSRPVLEWNEDMGVMAAEQFLVTLDGPRAT